MAEFTHLSHQPVLAAQAVRAMLESSPAAGETMVDATFGGGGHSRGLLRQAPAGCRLLALDCDEYAATQAARLSAELSAEAEDRRFIFARRNFADLAEALADYEIAEVCAVLFDLGVSGMQLDGAGRGFSFRFDEALDMRLDRRGGKTAAKWLRESSEADIFEALRSFGEEPEARRLARAMFADRFQLQTTGALAGLVRRVKRRRTPGRHPATQVFQALRIAVNQELDALRRGLQAAVEKLRVGGRLVVIAFHSLEDRIVKRLAEGITAPGLGRLRVNHILPVGKMLRPDAAAVAENPRARSARMRVFVKAAA